MYRLEIFIDRKFLTGGLWTGTPQEEDPLMSARAVAERLLGVFGTLLAVVGRFIKSVEKNNRKLSAIFEIPVRTIGEQNFRRPFALFPNDPK